MANQRNEATFFHHTMRIRIRKPQPTIPGGGGKGKKKRSSGNQRSIKKKEKMKKRRTFGRRKAVVPRKQEEGFGFILAGHEKGKKGGLWEGKRSPGRQRLVFVWSGRGGRTPCVPGRQSVKAGRAGCGNQGEGGREGGVARTGTLTSQSPPFLPLGSW